MSNQTHNLPSESHVDVLIIGAGPAGLMAANWMARYVKHGLTARIIDKRDGALDNGQADGLNSRSLEIFESLGFYDKIDKESSRMSEIAFWNPDQKTGRLSRTSWIPDTIPGLSRFQQTILHQNRIEKHLIDNTLELSDGKLVIERGVLPTELSVDEGAISDPAAYPVSVKVEHLSSSESTPESMTNVEGVKSGMFRSSLVSAEQEEGLYKKDVTAARRTEVIKAKYLIGCDGAHSWTRRTLGINMHGEQTNYVWGVLDLAPLTNFPDIRKRCAIHSASSGSVMVIPQERGLVRLYIQLPTRVKQGEYLDRSKITAQTILNTARAVFKPYTLDSNYIEWFTGYHIGQRLTESFSKFDRIFLAGDACHTHSPKAGQGMNTSMQDTFNLGWKLGHVITGLAKPELLKTYTSERQVVAKTLIDFDTKFSKLFSGKPATAESALEEEHISLDEFKVVFAKGNEFAAGMSIDYGPSQLVAKSDTDGAKQHLAPNLPIGKRFFSAQVVNVASATADQLTTRIMTNGAFRLLVFPGNVAKPEMMKRLRKFAEWLDRAESPVSKYTPRNRPRDSVVDVVTIHSSPREDVELYDFPQPSIFPPHNYSKVYVDGPSYHRGHGHCYEAYGIDPNVGAVIVVRPDQYVSLVVDLEDTEVLDRFFASFLIPAKDGGFPASEIKVVKPPTWEVPSGSIAEKGETIHRETVVVPPNLLAM